MKEGIYDLLVTQALQLALARLDSSRIEVEDLDPAIYPTYLTRHLLRQVKLAIEALPAADRPTEQLDLANRLLASLPDPPELVAPPARRLTAIYSTPLPPPRPTVPLGQSDLLMNAQGQSRLGFELEQEMKSADEVLMLVSFIQWRGWQRLKVAFEELADSGKPVRILTTTYIGASDYNALLALAALPNVELKISLDGQRRRLHAKAWLFERCNGFSTAYVGSANLSGPALEDGIEWTVRLSQVETPHNLERFRGAFATLWQDPEFLSFRVDDAAMCDRVRDTLEGARNRAAGAAPAPLFFDLKPHPYQQATLDQLEAERLDRGEYRNLVVAPTGTGKTLVAAFDYLRQIGPSGLRPRLLFLAHREEILRQARLTFRHLLRDYNFGELLAGGETVPNYQHLFATVQSFQSRDLLTRQGADYWHFAVLDEAHHTPAGSYRDLILALQPKILLGLTATPERMDGESILPWFGGHIADEMRLWHAIERQYLVPFDYYGIHDGVNLAGLNWHRGAYQVADLNLLYAGNQQRAELVVEQFHQIYGDWRKARALGFCVSVEHAEFMAAQFVRAGIPAEAVTGRTAAEARAGAPNRLRSREVNVLFAVDLYNEGVDIPEVDCLLFLRPTESSTVFLQQMGRGLRLDTGKTSCLVLDFIGNQRREFRYDLRFQSLFGGTRQQVIEQIDNGVTRLPGNCYFRLDKESRKVVLQNLRERLTRNRERIVSEIRSLRAVLRRNPHLAEFLDETQYELEDIYKGDRGWAALLAEASAEPRTEAELRLSRQFQYLLHVDSQRRLGLYQQLVARKAVELDEAQRRETRMLTFRLLQAEARQPGVADDGGLQRILDSPGASAEFLDLLEVLRRRSRLHVDEQPLGHDWPLYLHRQYARDEILTAVGYLLPGRNTSHREGRLRLEEYQTELFFVTLQKTEKQYSPTTRYEDFAVSPTRFHWQSQSTTSETSPTGQRYITQGGRFLLFVRPTTKDTFTFLGPVRYSSHTGTRPMSIYWDLVHPMPAGFFDLCASLRAA
ncbi:MAG: DUF3427 domain-containing protein [Bryobacteraceae bacterium]|nr:DUF3427 domain-containing protein [Bryobacteraceae bacterium]